MDGYAYSRNGIMYGAEHLWNGYSIVKPLDEINFKFIGKTVMELYLTEAILMFHSVR